MKLVFFGTPAFAVPSLHRLLLQTDFEIAGVVTQPDRRRGRGGRVTPSAVKAAAMDAGCPIWQPQRIKKDPDTLQALQILQADAFVVVAYGQILSPEILAMPKFGCINAHGSLLPKYRGAAPIQWSLFHGETETGVTTMQMDAGMDTGPMLLRSALPLGLLDNAWQVADRLAALSADLLADTLIKLYQQKLRGVPQPEAEASYAPLIQKADYELDWRRGAIALHNQIRGFYPNCITQFRDGPLKISESFPLEFAAASQLPPELDGLAAAYSALAELEPTPPGTIAALLKGFGPVISTGQGPLLLRQVQPTGKKAQSGWDFVNGHHLTLGETLG
ncbi:methionyl-tRNA formyltransferase [Romeria aff. gracilis LEGE 07310]|uniref:Methionyl-tRNA formyltransferase n=1 Tax=Vasconcelosia minhoensis LEGE 07310 TaxID=915328 RepID=A0A8J7AH14_9CYAN|nr:methionyl-tRNA formyltransferase [Romeria gracilis]MBE9078986.1 methionyl-tRNA formyltransferase [Romeria aff. gracilis LEGE 07310]